MAKATSCGAGVCIAGWTAETGGTQRRRGHQLAHARDRIAGIAFVTIVVSVLIGQAFSTGTVSLTGRHDKEYRRLVDELSAVQRDTAAELQRANDVLAQLRAESGELEEGIEEVDRVLKAVD